MVVDVCAKAKLAHKKILFEKYGNMCYEVSDFDYIWMTVKQDIVESQIDCNPVDCKTRSKPSLIGDCGYKIVSNSPSTCTTC